MDKKSNTSDIEEKNAETDFVKNIEYLFYGL